MMTETNTIHRFAACTSDAAATMRRTATTLLLAVLTITAWAQGNYWLNVEPNYDGGAAVTIPVGYDPMNGGYHYPLTAAYFEAQFNRPGDHHIAYFSTLPDGGDIYFPGETITLTTNPTTLYAQWDLDWSGSGTASDPYMIYTKEHLLLLAHRVNGTHGETAVEDGYSGKYFKLGADIAFPHADNEGEEYTENYEAIGMYDGTNDRNFLGDFDGDGHTVSGIRIRKTGTGDTDTDQGFFGQTDNGANIHDVHLTDARIKGYQNVGGIVGLNFGGTVSGCTVTDSYITATDEYGSICGYKSTSATLTNNYYHGCTVNGTAYTSGVGCQGYDIATNNGALPAYAITLGEGVSTTVLATAPENGFVKGGISYYRLGLDLPLTSTLGEAPVGYTAAFSADGNAISGTTYTVNATDCDATLTAALTAAFRSDGQQHNITYMKADGTPAQTQAIALDGYEAVDGDGDVCLDEGTYYVGTDITYANRIYLYGNITLILADGKTMTLASDVTGIAGYNLTIYGQSLDDATAGTLRYDGASSGILVNNYKQDSGNVSITTTGSGVWGIAANVTLQGGTLAISVDGTGARAIYGRTHSILGGQLTATATGIYALASSGTALTLSWTNPTDRITASSISAPDGGNVAVADGQALTDGSGNIYTGTLTASVLSGFAAETTLQPCLALADAADNTDAITDHAGQTLAVALSGRTLYKDGSWNTLCLPFSVTTASGTLSGNNVQAMTLNTASSSLTDGTLTLNFDATTETIPAGTPFIIKWNESGTDITDPVFKDVTIDAEKRDATVTGVLTFTGTYAPVTIPAAGDNTKLYLGDENTLFYPNAAMTIGCQRAYFQLAEGLTAGEPTNLDAGVRAFVLNFGDGITVDPSGIHAVSTDSKSAGAWYTLDGRKLDAVPTAKGLYINNGKKVIIK